MDKKIYSLGLDFGTLSARAILADAKTGKALEHESVFLYPHAIMNEIDGKALPFGYALQHPRDYIDALEFLIPDVLTKNKISATEVIGIGIDFTDCTIIPVDNNLCPMCLIDKYKNDPHAYAKLWKHHAKEEYAKAVLECAKKRNEKFLSTTGDTITSEFMLPKLLEIFYESRELYNDTYKFMQGGDFVASLLCNSANIHSRAFSAKQHYIGDEYPSRDFLECIDAELGNAYEEKTVTKLSPIDLAAGSLCKEWAEKTGLCEGISVALPTIDAYCAIIASGIKSGRAVLVLGTSAVFEAVYSSNEIMKDLLAYSYETVAPKMATIEAGLAAMGDLFEWFIKNCLPESYTTRAKDLGLNEHEYLRSLAENQRIGAHGLLALDWWNGCRSMTLSNYLSGTIIGLRLSTAPEDIYRALIESTAFGIRRIIDSLKEQGIEFSEIYASGGIALKDPLLMQILSDVLKLPIFCLATKQAAALGSAINASVAAGVYPNIIEASNKMASPIAKSYYPISSNHEEYEKIYSQYKELFDYYNRSENNIMTFLSQNKN